MPDLRPEQQRRTKRYKVDLRSKVAYRRNGMMQSAIARCQDVSEGGMSLFVPIDLSRDDSLQVEFTLPHSRLPLRVQAVVRNREGHRYGVEFLTLSETQKKEITSLCEAALKTQA